MGIEVKRTNRKMKNLGKEKRDYYSKQKNRKFLFLPKQRHLRYFNETKSSLMYLYSGAARIKYSYLDDNQVEALLNYTHENNILRKTNEKISDGYIKHKKKFFAHLKTYKDIMKNQVTFRDFASKNYGILYPAHPWNIVDKSPWPFVSGLSSFFFVLGFVSLLHGYGVLQLDLGLTSVIMSFIFWNRDIVREGSFQGKHTTFVKACLKTGFKYFIVSEFMLFFSFFWAFYHFYLNGSVETSYVYPPLGIGMDDKLPGIMNLVLIMSGSIITFSHIHYNLKVNREHLISLQMYLLQTIMFGSIFISCQIYEYCHNSFTFSDSTFGSVFYLLTGCHSLHVIIGVSFLAVSWVRNLKGHTTFHHNLNYTLAIWYWHFVDVIWIFLYLKIYYLFHFIASYQPLKYHYTMYDFSGGSMHFNYFELLLQKSLEKLGKA